MPCNPRGPGTQQTPVRFQWECNVCFIQYTLRAKCIDSLHVDNGGMPRGDGLSGEGVSTGGSEPDAVNVNVRGITGIHKHMHR